MRLQNIYQTSKAHDLFFFSSFYLLQSNFKIYVKAMKVHHTQIEDLRLRIFFLFLSIFSFCSNVSMLRGYWTMDFYAPDTTSCARFIYTKKPIRFLSVKIFFAVVAANAFYLRGRTTKSIPKTMHRDERTPPQ